MTCRHSFHYKKKINNFKLYRSYTPYIKYIPFQYLNIYGFSTKFEDLLFMVKLFFFVTAVVTCSVTQPDSKQPQKK